MSWALRDAPVESSQEHVVLLALADRAHDDGRDAYPAQKWIAERARCSTRTVRRCLNSLEARGLIVRGDQDHVSHIRSDVRPVVWDLNLAMKRPEPADTTVSARSDCPPGHLVQNGRTSRAERADTVVLQTVLNHPEPSLDIPGPKTLDENFDEWWSVYPKKAGKLAARKAYKAALKRTSADVLLAAVRGFVKANGNTDRQFIKNPATWLNGGHWDDEGIAPISDDSLRSWLREQWKSGNVAEIGDRSGIHFRPMEPPSDLDSAADIKAWDLQSKRDWITAKSEAILAAVAKREGVAA